MKIKKVNLMILTGDHGGYKSGYCAVCKTHGWFDLIKHEPECPVIPSEYEYLDITEHKE